jgi:hypothetical protein
MPVTRAFFYTSFKVPSKRAPPPRSPLRAPCKETLCFQSLLLPVSRSPR